MGYQSCRVCLCKTKSSIPLNTTCKKSSELIYICMFNMCTQLNAVTDDALPQHLCTSCNNNLIIAFDFLQLAQDSDCKLRQLYEGSRQTRSSGSKLILYKQLSNDGGLLQIHDVDKSCVEKNSAMVMGSNANAEFTRDPLEESDEEIDVDGKNSYKHKSKEDIWSDSDSANKIPSDVEDEDDKPLGELIKSELLTNFNADEDQYNSPSESLPDLNASPEEQLFPQGRYKCKICDKPYFTIAGLKVHIDIHLPKKAKTKTKLRKLRRNKVSALEEVVSQDLKDNLDEGGSNNKGNVRKRKLPKPKKMFPCHVCGKHMISASKLRYHMVMHTGEKDYLCTICPKAYSTIYALKHHMRTHTGERPYECNFCGDKFTRPTTLKSHMRRHTGERPYGCDICGKRFIQHSSMTTHMKLNHMAKTIPCPHCDKKYARQTDLTTHLLSHTGDKPFSCQLCPSRFIRQANLNKHMNQHHTNKSVASSSSSKETKKLQKVGKKVVMVEKYPVSQNEASEDVLPGTATFHQLSESIPSIIGRVAVSIDQPISTSLLPSDNTQHIIGHATNIIEPERFGRAIDDISRWSWPHAS